MAKNKKIANKNKMGVLKKGALCALLGSAMISGGLLVGCDNDNSTQAPIGTSFYYGSETPNPKDNPGKVGDFYIEIDTGYIWKLTEERWEFVSNLTGPQGPVGPQGSQGVGISNISTKSFCDADENMYMEITFTYSNGSSEVERVYLGHTIYVGSEMTLENAVEAVADGGEIVLTTDVELDKQINITKNVEIDLAGHKIANTNDVWNVDNSEWSLISVDGGNLVISNGTVDAKENDCYAIDIRNGGKCTIESGTYIGNVHAVYVKQGSLIVNGGTFDIKQLSEVSGDSRYTLNCFDESYSQGEATIAVCGGTFANYNPSGSTSEYPTADFVADGYKVEQSVADGNGDIWYTVVADENV